MNILKTIMIRAWEIARAGAAAFGGKVREYFRAALKQSWKENTMAEREQVDIGREGYITEELIYRNNVRCGGAVTPAVRVFTGFDDKRYVTKLRDGLSGSGRSGTITWQLEENRIYELLGVAVTSSRGETFYVSTYNNETIEIDAADLKDEVKRIYPQGAELARIREENRIAEQERRAAEAAKREREYAEKLENRRLELEAEAERIAEEGQGNADGLPDLTGSPKQIAWAIKIRDAVAKQIVGRGEKLAALKTATTAKYWIDNHKAALPR